MSDIVPPCDCIELIDGQFTYRCECSNRGDGERAAAWCVEANHKASADYDKCTIEFLRKEAAEQAAEIERLRAALRPFATALKGNWSKQPGSMKIVAGPHANDLRMELTLYDFRRAALEDKA